MNLTNTTTILALVISIVLPLLSSLLSKPHWPAEIAGIITLALSTATGFLTEWANAGGDYHWQTALETTLVSFGIAVLGRTGLWRNTVLDSLLLSVGAKPSSAVQSVDRYVAAHGSQSAPSPISTSDVSVVAASSAPLADYALPEAPAAAAPAAVPPTA
jgi:hypothetical protein